MATRNIRVTFFNVRERSLMDELWHRQVFVLELKSYGSTLAVKFSGSQRAAVKEAVGACFVKGLFHHCWLANVRFKRDEHDRPYMELRDERRRYLDTAELLARSGDKPTSERGVAQAEA